MTIRKITLAAAAFAAISTSIAATAEEDISDQGIGAIGWTPFQIGLLAPVSFPWGCDWDLKGLDINLLYMENVKFQGLGISCIATRTRDEVRGVLITGLCNWNECDFYGINLTLGVNLAFADVYGVQGGLFGMRKHMSGLDVHLLGSHQQTYRGVQVAGLCNFTLEEFKGAGIAFGLNMTKTMTGLQFGSINFAHELTGCQLGFFNIAEECPCGIQIGLVNIIMDNKVKVLPITNFYF